MSASSALVIGGLVGAYLRPPERLVAVALAFASGSLITALATDLFAEPFRTGGVWLSGIGLLAGASEKSLSVLLSFAGGAVLASLADTLMPAAYRVGGKSVAFATATGFFVSFVISE